MKLNQFGIQPTTTEQEIKELQQIKFLSNSQLQKPAATLFAELIGNCFPELTNPTLKMQQLENLMATPNLTVAQYLQQYDFVSPNVFYNVYFQLLGLEIDQDFTLATPQKTTVKLNYPAFAHNHLTTAEVIHGFYQLLITHTVNGQTYLDELASRGYFVELMKEQQVPQPLFFNGKAQPVFDTTQLINEVVYVESSQDTDHDGQRDLLKVEITRPAETNNGLKVPVLYTASPYNQGTNDAAGQKLTHENMGYQEPKQPQKSTLSNTLPQNPPIPAPRKILGHTTQVEQSFGNHFTYSLNDYFLARGFAVVYAAGIGTKDSDGFRTCGDQQETISTTAVIEWLTETRTAFTNKTDQIQIKAWWSNHKIAMTGRSYLGTLATAAATTGVKGLKTIISEAAISSWYDYYREHGLVVAPGGFQGEDCDVLAEETFSRQKQAGDYHKVQQRWQQHLQQITQGQERETGNYTDFWEQRNYRHQAQNIKADVILVHGLNDWNVKPKNVQKLWAKLRDLPITKKLILHQGPHIYINNNRSLDFNDMMNLWLSYKLYDVDNQADQILPTVLIQDNTVPETWHTYEDWCSPANPVQTYYLSDHYLTKHQPQAIEKASFTDRSHCFLTYYNNAKQWHDNLMNLNYSTLANNRLIFLSDNPNDQLIIDGRPTVHLRVASSDKQGFLSLRLVDFGTAQRLKPLPTTLAAQAYDQGYHYHSEDLKEYELDSQRSDYQLISLAHINLQNRHSPSQVERVTPNHFYDIDVQLQPTHYKLSKFHQLGLIIYSSDFEMTNRPNSIIDYTFELSHCSLDIPHL